MSRLTPLTVRNGAISANTRVIIPPQVLEVPKQHHCTLRTMPVEEDSPNLDKEDQCSPRRLEGPRPLCNSQVLQLRATRVGEFQWIL